MKELDDIIISNPPSQEVENVQDDCSNLITELTKIKNEGNDLYKLKKIEEAKDVYNQGIKKFDEKYSLIDKKSISDEKNKEILALYKKILSNMALCYYKQEKYKEAIEYDLKLLEVSPKFGKSLVRLIKSYSKLNLIEQAVYYGDLFLELDQETRDKFKDAQDTVQEEKQKLKKIKKAEEEKIKKDIAKYSVPAIVLLLAILIFLLFRKK